MCLSFILGTYWFPRDINELTLDSRPASPGTIDPSRNRSPPVELYLQRSAASRATPATPAAETCLPHARRLRLLLREHLELDHALDRVRQSSPCRALAPPTMVRMNQPRNARPAAATRRCRSSVIPARIAEHDERRSVEISWKLNAFAASRRAYVPGEDSANTRPGPKQPEEEDREVGEAGDAATGLLPGLRADQRLVRRVHAERPGRGGHLDQAVEGLVQVLAGPRGDAPGRSGCRTRAR